MKNLSKREKNRRKYLKMYKSVENKLHGENLIWWNSLSLKARYRFMFEWRWYRKYFPDMKFKHVLKMRIAKFVPHQQNKREALIDHFLK